MAHWRENTWRLWRHRPRRWGGRERTCRRLQSQRCSAAGFAGRIGCAQRRYRLVTAPIAPGSTLSAPLIPQTICRSQMRGTRSEDRRRTIELAIVQRVSDRAHSGERWRLDQQSAQFARPWRAVRRTLRVREGFVRLGVPQFWLSPSRRRSNRFSLLGRFADWQNHAAVVEALGLPRW